jgi:predicted transcriptional regulator
VTCEGRSLREIPRTNSIGYQVWQATLARLHTHGRVTIREVASETGALDSTVLQVIERQIAAGVLVKEYLSPRRVAYRLVEVTA